MPLLVKWGLLSPRRYDASLLAYLSNRGLNLLKIRPRIYNRPRIIKTKSEQGLSVGQARYTAYELGEEEELTPRETEIVQLAADGLINKQIAIKLSISYWTVKHHWRNINLKTHSHTQAQVVAKMLRRRKIR